jgi:hypothetical protein
MVSIIPRPRYLLPPGKEPWDPQNRLGEPQGESERCGKKQKCRCVRFPGRPAGGVLTVLIEAEVGLVSINSLRRVLSSGHKTIVVTALVNSVYFMVPKNLYNF